MFPSSAPWPQPQVRSGPWGGIGPRLRPSPKIGRFRMEGVPGPDCHSLKLQKGGGAQAPPSGGRSEAQAPPLSCSSWFRPALPRVPPRCRSVRRTAQWEERGVGLGPRWHPPVCSWSPTVCGEYHAAPGCPCRPFPRCRPGGDTGRAGERPWSWLLG